MKRRGKAKEKGKEGEEEDKGKEEMKMYHFNKKQRLSILI